MLTFSEIKINVIKSLIINRVNRNLYIISHIQWISDIQIKILIDIIIVELQTARQFNRS